MAKEPTEAQKKAGNYAKEHRFMHGMRLSIENKAGSTRKGVGEDGKPWESELAHDYGYVRYTTGKDKDHIDAFLSDDADNPDHKVYVVDQKNKKGDFDEHKVMMGFPSQHAAYDAYHANYEPGWDGFHDITEMDMPTFKKWAYSGKSGKRKPVSELQGFKKGGSIPCGCGDHRPGFAEGGSIDDEDLSKPAFLSPMVGKRREDRQDRAGATEMPLQALRGAVTGTLGFGGDMEGLGRSVAKFLGADVDETPVLPTGDFYRDIAPMAPQSAAGRAASGAGSALGIPMSGAVLGAVRGAERAAPVIKGALAKAAENAMAPTMLSKQAGAVKLPGGNWMPGGNLDQAVDDMVGGAFHPETKKWVQKKIPNYVRNQMSTAKDPLALGENNHLSRQDAARTLDDYDILPEDIDNVVGREAQDALADTLTPYAAHSTHKALTGRDKMSAWESLSDANMDLMRPGEAIRDLQTRGQPVPPWLEGMKPEEKVYDLTSDFSIEQLGIPHMLDYINSAVEAGQAAKLYGRAGFEGEDGLRMNQLLARNLDIDPDKLSQMTFDQISRKTADWNKMLAEAQKLEDMNKGIKTVHKQYPDTGHQWVELDPEGLGAEGRQMGHCVGGYCSSVEGGGTRILSLRDKDGAPHVTVELAKPKGRVATYQDLDEGFRNGIDQEVAAMAGRLDEAAKVGNVTPAAREQILDVHRRDLINDQLRNQYPDFMVPPAEGAPWEIRQIKGKGNKAPIKDYLPAVQDLVKNMGPWGDDVRDLQNTGLRPTANVFNDVELNALRERGREPSKYLSTQDIVDHQRALGMADEDIKKLYDPWNEGRLGFAMGGSISAGNTVPLATFAQGDGTQPVANAGNGWGFTPGTTTPAVGGSSGGSAMGSSNAYGGYNGDLSNGPPTSVNTLAMGQGGAPTYSTNGLDAFWAGDKVGAQAMDQGLKNTLTAGSQGLSTRGINAFLGTYTPVNLESTNNPGEFRDAGEGYGRAKDLAAQMGMSGKYAGQDDATFLKNFDSDLSNYYSIGGLAGGWNGNGVSDPRAASTTMYMRQGDQLVPVSQPKNYHAMEDPGWVKGKGAETITALSMMLPAVGGWAGLVGQAAGTTGATVANVAGNVALGAARGGEGGALSALAGGLGGAVGGAAGGALGGYNELGSTLGSNAAKYFTTKKT